MNIKKFIAIGTPERLIEAVIKTRQQIDSENPHGLKAGSDRWTYDMSFFRPLLIDQIRRTWCEATGHEPYDFPFRDDIVMHMWIACRKCEYTLEALMDDSAKIRIDGLFPSAV